MHGSPDPSDHEQQASDTGAVPLGQADHGRLEPVEAPEPTPVDPLAGLSPRKLRRIARRAHRTRRARVGRFEQLAARTGVSLRRLRILADAWAAGGGSGVTALGPAPREGPSQALDRAPQVIESWRRLHFPLDALRVDRWRNRVTVWRLVPNEDRTASPAAYPLMQLRLTEDRRWHLYRKAAQGEWWPVRVRGRRAYRQCLSACLDVVRADIANEFWGPQGPPEDLAPPPPFPVA